MAKADEHNVQWKTVKLGEVGEINPSNKEPLPNQFIYIDLESVVAGELLTENHINKKEAPSRAQRIVYKDDVLYQTVRPYQKNNYIHKKEGDYVASTGYALIRCYKEYNPDFLYYKLHTYQVESVVLGLCTGTSYPAIAPNYLKKIEISVPDLPTQGRIAAILSAADKVIEQTRQLIGKYKSIKQGMMEDLLKPKEGWKKVKLGEVAQTFTGLTYSPSNINNSGTLVLRSSNIKDGRLCFEDNVFVSMDIPERAMVHENDILICVRNGSRNLIGKCALITKDAIGMAFGAFMTVLRSTTIEPKLLLYIWQSNDVQRQVANNIGATINQITNADFNRFEISVPDLPEQRRIAKILSGIDRKIEAEEKVLGKYEKMKKGLMERLLIKE